MAADAADPDPETAVAATPIDLGVLVKLGKPVVRVRYEFAEIESPGLEEELDRFLARLPGAAKALTNP